MNRPPATPATTWRASRSNSTFAGIAGFALLAVLCLQPLRAQQLLLKGAVVHTVSGQTFSAGDLLIKGEKIVGVGPSIDAPGATTIDLNGRHVYPGLIAAGTLLGLLEIEAVRATRDSTEVGSFTPDVQSWVAVNPDSELIPVARANGITHVLPIPLGATVSGQSGLIALTGWTTEQMLVKRPAALHLFWPAMNLDPRPKSEFKGKEKWRSLEDQARERQAKLEAIHRFFAEAKAYANAAQISPTAGKNGGPVPAWEAMLPFVRGEIPLMIHADDVREIKAAVTWASTNGFRTILAGGRDAAMIADFLATHKVPVLFEHIFAQPAQDDASYDVYFRTPAELRRAGVKVLLGEGLDTSAAATLRNLPYSAAQAVAFGLSEEEALKAITLSPAQVLGVADRLGSLETGKEATFFVSDRNILDIRATVQRMWIAGTEVNLSSRHTRLYEKYRNRPKAE